MKIGFIGAGKVGFSLGRYFKENNTELSGYISKNPDSAKEAAKFTNSEYFNSLCDFLKETDLVFITTPDKEIKGVYDNLVKVGIKDKIIIHCSGSLSSLIFHDIEKHHCYGYSLHPLYPICSKYVGYKDLKASYFSLEGSEKYLDDIKALMNSCGNEVILLNTHNKSLYHAAAVMSSNLILSLIDISINLLKSCGFHEAEAKNAIMPLIESNINNIKNNPLKDALTGPVERNDVDTVKNHLDNLDFETQLIYKALSKNLISIAEMKNPHEDYKLLKEIIGGSFNEKYHTKL